MRLNGLRQAGSDPLVEKVGHESSRTKVDVIVPNDSSPMHCDRTPIGTIRLGR